MKKIIILFLSFFLFSSCSIKNQSIEKTSLNEDYIVKIDDWFLLSNLEVSENWDKVLLYWNKIIEVKSGETKNISEENCQAYVYQVLKTSSNLDKYYYSCYSKEKKFGELFLNSEKIDSLSLSNFAEFNNKNQLISAGYNKEWKTTVLIWNKTKTFPKNYINYAENGIIYSNWNLAYIVSWKNDELYINLEKSHEADKIAHITYSPNWENFAYAFIENILQNDNFTINYNWKISNKTFPSIIKMFYWDNWDLYIFTNENSKKACLYINFEQKSCYTAEKEKMWFRSVIEKSDILFSENSNNFIFKYDTESKKWKSHHFIKDWKLLSKEDSIADIWISKDWKNYSYISHNFIWKDEYWKNKYEINLKKNSEIIHTFPSEYDNFQYWNLGDYSYTLKEKNIWYFLITQDKKYWPFENIIAKKYDKKGNLHILVENKNYEIEYRKIAK